MARYVVPVLPRMQTVASAFAALRQLASPVRYPLFPSSPSGRAAPHPLSAFNMVLSVLSKTGKANPCLRYAERLTSTLVLVPPVSIIRLVLRILRRLFRHIGDRRHFHCRSAAVLVRDFQATPDCGSSGQHCNEARRRTRSILLADVVVLSTKQYRRQDVKWRQSS